MTDVACRSDDLAPLPRRSRRGGASRRGGFDRSVPRIEGVADRFGSDAATRPVLWPVVPRRDAPIDTTVAPSSTIPAVVAPPRVTTAAPVGAADCASAPAIRVAADARRPLPADRRGRGVAAAVLTHLLCLAALLAMSPVEPSGGGVETEAVEIAIVFAEASLDAEAGAASRSREATPAPPPPDPVPPEPVAADPPPPSPETAAATPPAFVPPTPDPPRFADPEVPPPEEPRVLATATPAETAVPPFRAPPAPPAVAPRPAPSVVAAIEPRKPVPAPKSGPQPTRSERRTVDKPRPIAPASSGTATRNSTSGALTAGAVAAAGPGAVADWRAAVLAALARAKRFPDDARDRGVTGRAVVGFTLSRDGRVSAVVLVASSGVPALDAATLAMPHRASFPPMPAGGPPTRSFTAGVRYDLR